MSSLLGRWLSHTTEHGCAGVDVKSMARRGVNCRRPPPSLTRVINDRRIVKTGGSGRQVHGGSRCTSCSVLSSGWRSRHAGRGDEGEAQPPARTTPASSHSPGGQLDVVGGACAHPDELPRRVMTTHPAAVDAGPRTASGGSVESRKYRTCGHGCVRPGFVRVQLATRVLRHKAWTMRCTGRLLHPGPA